MKDPYKELTESIDTFLFESKSEEERQSYIKSLQLKQGEHDLTDHELKDFAKRSHAFRRFPSSPLHISADQDIKSMSHNRLKQVIAHPKVNVFYKHKARKRLTDES